MGDGLSMRLRGHYIVGFQLQYSYIAEVGHSGSKHVDHENETQLALQLQEHIESKWPDLLLKVFPLASQAEGVVWVEIRLEKGWLFG